MVGAKTTNLFFVWYIIKASSSFFDCEAFLFSKVKQEFVAIKK